METSGTLISCGCGRKQNGKMILLIFVLVFSCVHQQIRHIPNANSQRVEVQKVKHVLLCRIMKTFQCN